MEEEGGREFYAARLVEERAPEQADSSLTAQVAQIVRRCVEWVEAKFTKAPPRGDVGDFIERLVSLGVGALEGKLRAHSLDAELKAAQIEASYAQARRDNAEHLKLAREEAESRLRDRVEALRRLGVPVVVHEDADGPMFMLGEGAGKLLDADTSEAVGAETPDDTENPENLT